MEFNRIFNYVFAALFFLIITVFLTTPGFCAKKQFTPSVSITEKYTDNFHQTQNNKDDEFSTQYKAGFSFGVIDKQLDRSHEQIVKIHGIICQQVLLIFFIDFPQISLKAVVFIFRDVLGIQKLVF